MKSSWPPLPTGGIFAVGKFLHVHRGCVQRQSSRASLDRRLLVHFSGLRHSREQIIQAAQSGGPRAGVLCYWEEGSFAWVDGADHRPVLKSFPSPDAYADLLS